jgi:hypothetical protein
MKGLVGQGVGEGVDALTQSSHNCADGVSRGITSQRQVAQRCTALRLLICAAAACAQLGHQRGRVVCVRLLRCASRRGFARTVVARADSRPVHGSPTRWRVAAATLPPQRAREQRRGPLAQRALRACLAARLASASCTQAPPPPRSRRAALNAVQGLRGEKAECAWGGQVKVGYCKCAAMQDCMRQRCAAAALRAYRRLPQLQARSRVAACT